MDEVKKLGGKLMSEKKRMIVKKVHDFQSSKSKNEKKVSFSGCQSWI